jgi:hypothetical protein
LRIVVKKEYQGDKGKPRRLEFDAARVSRDVFAGAAVELHACDEYLRTVLAIPPRADVRYGVVAGNAEVFFATDVERRDAMRLADYLAGELVGQPGLITFKLARRDATVEVSMVVNPEAGGTRTSSRTCGRSETTSPPPYSRAPASNCTCAMTT